MVNPGVILLISISIILTIGITLLLIWVAIEERHNQGQSGTTGSSLPSCSQNINISSLLQIPDNSTECIQNGRRTSLHYIGTLGTGNYDYVVAPWATQPL